jgi:hypothetical protein
VAYGGPVVKGSHDAIPHSLWARGLALDHYRSFVAAFDELGELVGKLAGEVLRRRFYARRIC